MKFYKDITEAHPNSKIYDKCWDGYRKVPGKKRGEEGSCKKIKNEAYDAWDEADMWYKFDTATKKLKQKSWYHAQEHEARAAGWHDSHDKAMQAHGYFPSKFKRGEYVIKGADGKWIKVFPYADNTVKEFAPTGGDSGNNYGGNLYDILMGFISQHYSDLIDHFGNDAVDSTVSNMVTMGSFSNIDPNNEDDLEDAVAQILTQLEQDLGENSPNPTPQWSLEQMAKKSQKITKETQPVTDNSLGYKNTLAVMKAADSNQKATINLGSEPITLDYPEARFIAGKYKSYLRAGRQEEFFGYMSNPKQFDSMMKQLRDLIDKQKNFKGSVPGERGVGEDAPALAKMAGGLGLGVVAAAGAPTIVGILGPLLGIPLAAYGAYSAAKMGMKGVEKLWDMATSKLGSSEKVEQYAKAQIAKLPPEKAQAASAVIKQVAESRSQAQQAGVSESMRLVGKHGAGSKTAKVYKDHDWGEYRVKFYTDGKHEGEEADYHTDDKDDAHDTAKSWTTKGQKVAENTYWCRVEKTRKFIPEGYKAAPNGYIIKA